jgi:hypothetical protein
MPVAWNCAFVPTQVFHNAAAVVGRELPVARARFALSCGRWRPCAAPGAGARYLLNPGTRPPLAALCTGTWIASRHGAGLSYALRRRKGHIQHGSRAPELRLAPAQGLHRATAVAGVG